MHAHTRIITHVHACMYTHTLTYKHFFRLSIEVVVIYACCQYFLFLVYQKELWVLQTQNSELSKKLAKSTRAYQVHLQTIYVAINLYCYRE